MKNNYENVYILKGSLTEKQALKEIENIKEYFKNTEIYERRNDKNGYIGKKMLAYNIGEETQGYWYITHFKSVANEVTEIEQKLRENNNVMKFITVKLEG